MEAQLLALTIRLGELFINGDLKLLFVLSMGQDISPHP